MQPSLVDWPKIPFSIKERNAWVFRKWADDRISPNSIYSKFGLLLFSNFVHWRPWPAVFPTWGGKPDNKNEVVGGVAVWPQWGGLLCWVDNGRTPPWSLIEKLNLGVHVGNCGYMGDLHCGYIKVHRGTLRYTKVYILRYKVKMYYIQYTLYINVQRRGKLRYIKVHWGS